ncbi:hypothetical protein RJ639_028117, partial [Escallonia herrerae]
EITTIIAIFKMPILKPFQLLEINIISAQDLEPMTKKMRTYATAWVHPKRKLSTRVETEGHTNPTWNDKFVFRVDEEFLRLDTSAVMIELYAVHWFRDTLVGTVRVLVGNLIPPSTRSHPHNHHHLGMRFVALQVRRPSGRPQGILNIGVAVLDSSMRSMPLYTQLSTSAVGYRDLMGEEDPHNHNHYQNQNQNQNHNQSNNNPTPNVKPILRRTKSERSERVTFDNVSATNSSIIGIPPKKGAHGKSSSIISGDSQYGDPFKGKGKRGKASSVISGAELREPLKQKGKASSVVSDSIVSKDSLKAAAIIGKPLPIINKGDKKKVTNEKPESENSDPPTNKAVDEKSVTMNNGSEIGAPPNEVIGKPISKFNGYELGGPKGSLGNGKFTFGPPAKANSLWSDSEVGPSPSEVAAAMVEKRYPLEEDRSSVLDGWSLDESVEGLRSKLERWRTELPPLYDRGLSSSSFHSTSHHARRHTDGGSGLFSCFGNVYGYECQCICGKPPGNKSLSARFQSPSIGSAGRSFL